MCISFILLTAVLLVLLSISLSFIEWAPQNSKEKIKNLNKLVEILNSKINTIVDENTTLKQEKTIMTTKIDELQKNSTDLNDRNKTLVSDKENLTKEIDLNVNKSTDLNDKIELLKSQNTTLVNDRKNLTEEIDQCFKKIANLTNIHLYLNALNGDLPKVKFMVSNGADVNEPSYGDTPLFMSSKNGHLEVVTYLINHGANVNQENQDGETPLSISSQNDHLQVVKCLVENGAYVNKSRNNGTTSLFESSIHGHLAVVKFLVESGADVNQPDNEGSTPFLMSSFNNHFYVAEYLIEKGADVNQADGDMTPLILKLHTCAKVAKLIMINQFHIPTNIDINYYAVDLILNLLSQNEDDEFLLKDYANIDDDNYNIPPRILSLFNHTEVVRNYTNIDTTQANNYDDNSLMLSLLDHIKFAKLLIRNHANIESTKLFFENQKQLEFIEILENLCNQIEEKARKQKKRKGKTKMENNVNKFKRC